MLIRKNANGFVVDVKVLLVALHNRIRVAVANNKVRVVITAMIGLHVKVIVVPQTALRVIVRKVIVTRQVATRLRAMEIIVRKAKVRVRHVRATGIRHQLIALVVVQVRTRAPIPPIVEDKLVPLLAITPTTIVRAVVIALVVAELDKAKIAVAVVAEVTMPTGVVAVVAKRQPKPMFGRQFSKPTPGCRAIRPTGVLIADEIAGASAKKIAVC
ncbi:hypothetical protein GCM10028808_42230 [Spirosoma migulaei]